MFRTIANAIRELLFGRPWAVPDGATAVYSSHGRVLGYRDAGGAIFLAPGVVYGPLGEDEPDQSGRPQNNADCIEEHAPDAR